jgi:tetratricopeptide (TPR) repeat protein
MTAYEDRRYPEAAEALEKAYELRQLPRLLLSLGTVYRKMGDARKALDYYEQYLKAEPNPPAEVKTELDQAMTETRALLASKEPKPDPGTSPVVSNKPSPPPPENQVPIYKRPLFWGIVGGVVVVGLVAGIAGGVAASRKIPDDIDILQLQLRF